MAIFMGLLLPAVTIAAQDSVSVGTRPVTLAEAIRLAQQNSPQTIGARGTVRANQAAVRSAYGAFLPSITANVGAGRQFTGGNTSRINPQGERVTVQDQFTYSNSLSFSAQLLNLNRFPNLRAAQADVNAARAGIVVQSFDVALSVEQEFYTALSALESEDAARSQLVQAQQQLDAARKRVIAGAATASDSLRSMSQVAQAQLALLSAQNTRRDANAALTRLVGSPAPVSAAMNDPAIRALDTVRVDSATLITRAVEGPNVTQAVAGASAARSRRQAARAAYFPTLNASYSRGGSGLGTFGFNNDPFQYNGQLNFGLSYPIFNQFSREEQIARATVNEDNAAATLRDSRLLAQQLAVQYLDALRLGQEQIAVQTSTIVADQEDVRVQQQRYNLGLSTIVDLLTAQTALNQAQASLIAARNTVRLATAQIEALVGRPLTTITAGPNGATR